jgi:lipid II:glycine glycyltransferase (peptidoglycan interpeptide bridge formation enzyme)
VTIRDATLDDLPILYDLYRVTGERDGFLTRPPDYYEKAWRDFMQAGLAHALIAEADGKAIAHVILFHFGRKCWYFYGASSNEERSRMPNYALQWEAMRWAKAQGYALYDMWGAPDDFVETDSMWGVYEFKRGFRGTVVRHVGAWDYARTRCCTALIRVVAARARLDDVKAHSHSIIDRRIRGRTSHDRSDYR